MGIEFVGWEIDWANFIWWITVAALSIVGAVVFAFLKRRVNRGR